MDRRWRKPGLWDNLYAGILSEAKNSGYATLYDTYKDGALDAAASIAQSDIDAAAEAVVKPAVDGMYAWTDEKINEVFSKGFMAQR